MSFQNQQKGHSPHPLSFPSAFFNPCFSHKELWRSFHTPVRAPGGDKEAPPLPAPLLPKSAWHCRPAPGMGCMASQAGFMGGGARPFSVVHLVCSLREALLHVWALLATDQPMVAWHKRVGRGQRLWGASMGLCHLETRIRLGCCSQARARLSQSPNLSPPGPEQLQQLPQPLHQHPGPLPEE